MRNKFIQDTVVLIENRLGNRPFTVGIDGVDGAGKTTFAEELNASFIDKGISTIRASIDGFHRPRKERVAKGEFSPEGYYEDSFDYIFLIENFLEPIKNFNSSATVHLSNIESKFDETSSNSTELNYSNTIIIFEGVFLFRPELEIYWDFKIYVDIDFELSLTRGLKRDSDWMGGDSITKKKYRERYIPGQKIYLERVDPKLKADLVFDNRHPEKPQII